jgi:hypothetical protein
LFNAVTVVVAFPYTFVMLFSKTVMYPASASLGTLTSGACRHLFRLLPDVVLQMHLLSRLLLRVVRGHKRFFGLLTCVD